jgi:hypothetical protein
MIVSSCKKDREDSSPVEAKGQVEVDGKKYPLHECRIMVSGSKAPYEYLVSFESISGCAHLFFTIKSSLRNSLAEGKFTELSITSGAFYCQVDNSSNLNGILSEIRLEITRYDNDYSFIFTATAKELHNFKNFAYKMTYQGIVNIVDNVYQ